MHKTRALLDSLMGPSRNKLAKDRSGEDFLERKICKNFLVGFCPHSVLGGKIEGWQKCTKVHSQAMIEELGNHTDHEKYQKEYEHGLRRLLSDLASEADSRGSREKRRKRPPETIVRIPEHLLRKIENYEETKRNLLRIAKEKGDKDDEKGKEEFEHEATRAQVQIDSIRKSHTTEFPGEEVCEACGVRYLLGQTGDPDDHFETEAHKGYIRAREKLAELIRKTRQGKEEKDLDKETENGKSQSKAKAKDAEKDRKKARDSDSSNEKEGEKKGRKDKENHKGKDKGKEKERDKELEKKKHKDSDSDREEKGKDRLKQKEKDKSKKKSRDSTSASDNDRDRDGVRDRDRDRRKDKGDSRGKHDRDRDSTGHEKDRRKEDQSRSRDRNRTRKARDTSHDRGKRKRDRS